MWCALHGHVQSPNVCTRFWDLTRGDAACYISITRSTLFLFVICYICVLDWLKSNDDSQFDEIWNLFFFGK